MSTCSTLYPLNNKQLKIKLSYLTAKVCKRQIAREIKGVVSNTLEQGNDRKQREYYKALQT